MEHSMSCGASKWNALEAENAQLQMPYPRSCVNCAQCWHYSPEEEESGTAGWVCDGRNGVQNLKSFPFRTEQKCFTPSLAR